MVGWLGWVDLPLQIVLELYRKLAMSHIMLNPTGLAQPGKPELSCPVGCAPHLNGAMADLGRLVIADCIKVPIQTVHAAHNLKPSLEVKFW